MCLPLLAAGVGTKIAAGAMLAGGLTSAYGQYQQGQYQGDVADENARRLRMEAADAELRGGMEGDQIRREGRKVAGQQAASIAASGVSMASGSPLDILTETAELSERDAMVAENNAKRAAYGYRTAATDSRSQGAMARRAGTFGAGATILGSAGSAGATYFGAT
jgi:hypothetical protein